jgi:subtilisin family serine protease
MTFAFTKRVLVLAMLIAIHSAASAIECLTPREWQQKLHNPQRDANANYVQDSLEGIPDTPMTVILDLTRCPTPADLASLSTYGDVAYRGRYVSFAILRGALPSTFVALGKEAVVAFVEPNTMPHTTLDVSREVIGTGAAETTYGLLGSGVTIAVMDTGVDDGVHVSLPSDAFVGGMDCTPCSCLATGDACFADSDCPTPGDTCQCSCYLTGTPCLADEDCGPGGYCEAFPACAETNPDDDLGHGTHVASVALGRGGGDCPDCKGVAIAAGLVDVKVFSAVRTAFQESFLVALEELLDRRESWGVGVLNMSLGISCDPSNGTDAFAVLSNRAVAEGIVVVAAAGNASSCGVPAPSSLVVSPAAADDVISVANANDKNTISMSDDDIHSSSLRGPRLPDPDEDTEDEKKPDLAAPGSAIDSAEADTAGEYDDITGTSFSSPHVAGCAALLLQAAPEMSALSVKDLLRKHVVDKGAPGWDPEWGGGMLDCFGAADELGVTIGTDLGFEIYFCLEGSDPPCWRSPELYPADPKIVEGVPNTIVAEITNFGAAAAPTFLVTLGAYNFGNGQENYPICTVPVPGPLAPGGTATVSCDYTPLLSGAPPGSVHACLRAEVIYPLDTNFTNQRAQHNVNIEEAFSPATYKVHVSNPSMQALDMSLVNQWLCECPPPGSGDFHCPCPGWVFENSTPTIPLDADSCPVTVEVKLDPIDPMLTTRRAMVDLAVIGVDGGGGQTPYSGVTLEAELACQTTALVWTSKTQLTWQPPIWQVCPDLYDVARGPLPIAPVPGIPGGNFQNALCLANDIPQNSFTANIPPPPGQGYWFLVRTDQANLLPGTWNTGFPSEAGSRDRTLQVCQ